MLPFLICHLLHHHLDLPPPLAIKFYSRAPPLLVWSIPATAKGSLNFLPFHGRIPYSTATNPLLLQGYSRDSSISVHSFNNRVMGEMSSINWQQLLQMLLHMCVVVMVD